MRLLIAEGSPILRKRLTRLFSDLGYISLVAFVEKLDDVLKIALEEKPDVIVLDIDFPNLLKLKIIRALKEEIKHPRIIVLTETIEPRLIRKFKNAGADTVFETKDDLGKFIGYLGILDEGVEKTTVA